MQSHTRHHRSQTLRLFGILQRGKPLHQGPDAVYRDLPRLIHCLISKERGRDLPVKTTLCAFRTRQSGPKDVQQLNQLDRLPELTPPEDLRGDLWVARVDDIARG